MRFIVCEDYDELSKKAAEFVSAQIMLKPNCNLGLATGSTPIGMYKNLVDMNLDFSEVTTFNLDEYYPILRSNPQSYHYFMTEHLYKWVNLKKTIYSFRTAKQKTPHRNVSTMKKQSPNTADLIYRYSVSDKTVI